MAETKYLYTPNLDKIPITSNDEQHFATLKGQDDFYEILETLPNPDVVLREKGIGLDYLRDLKKESHLSCVMENRCGKVAAIPFSLKPSGDTSNDKKAYDFCNDIFSRLDIFSLTEDIMEAVAFGYSPLEILWKPDGKYWNVGNLVGKPPEWFAFKNNATLCLKKGFDLEECPPGRFILVQHRARYNNPYGEPLLSKCFWPVTFRLAGWKWTVKFVEKFGSAFLFGKYEKNTSTPDQMKLLKSLVKMLSSAVAIFPKENDVTIQEAGGKRASGSIQFGFLELCAKEISKVILGQTLTTDVSDKGTYAASKTHNEVRNDLAAGDRRLVAKTLNQFFRLVTRVNFADAKAPRFSFDEPKDYAKRAGIDKQLKTLGVGFKKSYFIKHYDLDENDFEIEESQDDKTEERDDSFNRNTSLKMFQGLLNWFKKPARQNRKLKRSQKLGREFADTLAEKGQKNIDSIIDQMKSNIDDVDSYEEAYEALAKNYPDLDLNEMTGIIDNIHFAGTQIGGKNV